MVVFRCKRSGNTVSFTNPDDIAQLRIHEGYVEVKDESKNSPVSGEIRQAAAETGSESHAGIEPSRNEHQRSEQKAKDVLTRKNGKVDKRSLAYRQSIGR